MTTPDRATDTCPRCGEPIALHYRKSAEPYPCKVAPEPNLESVLRTHTVKTETDVVRDTTWTTEVWRIDVTGGPMVRHRSDGKVTVESVHAEAVTKPSGEKNVFVRARVFNGQVRHTHGWMTVPDGRPLTEWGPPAEPMAEIPDWLQSIIAELTNLDVQTGNLLDRAPVDEAVADQPPIDGSTK